MLKKIVLSLVLLVRCFSVFSQDPAGGQAWVFAYFRNNGEDGLHLAYSYDGLKWKALKNDSSMLRPLVGTDKLMRDPCIVKGGDGKFHMVWTVSWKEKGIGYACSDDLIHWSGQQYIPLMEQEKEALNCWAPEINYDPVSKRYLIYWATTIPGRFPETEIAGDKNHRIYSVWTKDFKTFTAPEILYDRGFNVIDASIQQHGKQFVMFLKNETKTPAPEKNIRVAFSSALGGPYGAPSPAITGKYWAEGPTAIKKDGVWIVYFDRYTEHKYGAVSSKDLHRWTDISDQLSMPAGARHGTVFQVTPAELGKLISSSAEATAARQTDTLSNGLSLTPAMGWSSWNTFKKNPSEQVIREIADAMVSTGLKDAGYQFVNVDDFWSPGRDKNGKIRVDSVKFPSGMKALADYIHSKGLKAGIYTNIGDQANYETLASGGYYESDMQQFADWGFDFVKVDVNFAPLRTAEAYSREFEAVARAILKTGRPMVFSICNQGGRAYWTWAPGLGNSWRVGPDIDHTPKQKAQWEGVLYELDLSASHPEIARPGHWNDADMMLVGVGDDGGRLTVMNEEESKSHFSLWCMITSPLMLGNDLRSVSRKTLALITNKELIAINQDSLGYQGRIAYEQSPGLQVWQKKIRQNGVSKIAVCLFNRTDQAAKITLRLDKIGLQGTHTLRDLWLHKSLGKVRGSYERRIPAHGVAMLVIE